MNSQVKSFKINEIITLKLEEGKSNLYINDKLFYQCKSLLLEIPFDEREKFDLISSIDEAAEILKWSKNGQEVNQGHSEISPEEEFWGHCSNLQTWVENHYDTRLLHRSIAFPLLEKLADIGDLQARKVFKEELVKRFTSGSTNVIIFLIENGYHDYLSKEEIFSYVLSPEESCALEDTGRLTNTDFRLAVGINSQKDLFKEFLELDYTGRNNYFILNSGQIDGLKILWLKDPPYLLPNSLVNLKHLRMLDLDLFLDLDEEEDIDDDEFLLVLREGIKSKPLPCVRLPPQVTELTSLEVLRISALSLDSIPSSIGKLTNLKELIISNGGYDIHLPNTVINLKKLTKLDLMGGEITIPESIGELSNLTELQISARVGVDIPESIEDLQLLESLVLSGNIKEIPYAITRLKNLKRLVLPKYCISEKIKSWLKSINLKHEWSSQGSEAYAKP